MHLAHGRGSQPPQDGEDVDLGRCRHRWIGRMGHVARAYSDKNRMSTKKIVAGGAFANPTTGDCFEICESGCRCENRWRLPRSGNPLTTDRQTTPAALPLD